VPHGKINLRELEENSMWKKGIFYIRMGRTERDIARQ
jgi:hypothetical protein